MEITHCIRRQVLIILLLVTFLSSVPCFASKINGSSDARGIQYTNRKRNINNLTGSKQGEQPLCGFQKPEDNDIFVASCVKGYVISEIKFADYGQPTGSCKTFKHGNCGAPSTLRLVKKNCVGKEQCYLFLTDEMFGPTHCKGPVRFAIFATCKKKAV